MSSERVTRWEPEWYTALRKREHWEQLWLPYAYASATVPDDLEPFDTWPADQNDADFTSEAVVSDYRKEAIDWISAQLKQTPKDIVKEAVKGSAQCLQCGLVNEYATPSAEYMCFECRV